LGEEINQPRKGFFTQEGFGIEGIKEGEDRKEAGFGGVLFLRIKDCGCLAKEFLLLVREAVVSRGLGQEGGKLQVEIRGGGFRCLGPGEFELCEFIGEVEEKEEVAGFFCDSFGEALVALLKEEGELPFDRKKGRAIVKEISEIPAGDLILVKLIEAGVSLLKPLLRSLKYLSGDGLVRKGFFFGSGDAACPQACAGFGARAYPP